MPAPAVTVLMPAFNAARTVARAVESIRRQTLESWELVAVDDGSTDGTGGALDGLARADARIRVLRHPHRGIVAALQSGLASARGTFIARMDADDEAHPERLEAQVEFLNRRPGTGLVGSLVEFGGDATAAAGYALHVEWMNGLIKPDEIALNRFVESPFAHPSVMFRHELIERHGGYCDGNFPEDYELWLRWLDAGVVMEKAPRVLLKWNDAPGRLSRADPRYDPEAFYECKAGYLARWLRREVDAARGILVWGAGRPTRKRAAHIEIHGIGIAGYIDIDPRKLGRRFAGRTVIAPDAIPPAEEVFVVGYVARRGARDLAREFLRGRGFVEGRDFLMAA